MITVGDESSEQVGHDGLTYKLIFQLGFLRLHISLTLYSEVNFVILLLHDYLTAHLLRYTGSPFSTITHFGYTIRALFYSLFTDSSGHNTWIREYNKFFHKYFDA